MLHLVVLFFSFERFVGPKYKLFQLLALGKIRLSFVLVVQRTRSNVLERKHVDVLLDDVTDVHHNKYRKIPLPLSPTKNLPTLCDLQASARKPQTIAN